MELLIENQRLDLPPKAVFAITVQSNDITTPDKVQSSYSNTLTVPFTERNHRVLENAADLNSWSDVPYKELEATVLSDGVEVVPLPKAFLVQASDGYELQVFSGALDLFARFGDKSIRDLDLSRFNHVWNAENVVAGAAAGRTYLDGYIYPALDNGKPGRWAEDMHPAVFVRTVFEQMLSEAGVKYTGIEDELWDRLILPFSNDKPRCVVPPGKSKSWLEIYPDPWTIDNYGVIKVVLTAEMTRISTNPNAVPRLWMQLLRGGVEVATQTVEMKTAGYHELQATLRIESYEDLSQLELRLEPLNWTADSGNPSQGSYYRYYTYDEEAVFKSEWSVAANLPDIKQKDFFKAVRALFDLMPMFDPYSNTVSLVPFNKLQEHKPQALDWSLKLVYLRGQERVPLQYRFGEFAQRNWWRYREDELGGEGDAFLTVNDRQLEAEKSVVELPFAASKEAGGFLYLPLWKRKEEKEQSYTKTTNTISSRNSSSFDDGDMVLVKDATADPFVREGWAIYERVEGRFNSSDGWVVRQQQGLFYERNKLQPRIAVLHPESIDFSIQETRTRTVQVQGRGCSFSPLSFTSLLPTRYRALQGVLDKTKGITPHFLLTAADVANYDPSVPIWLDQFQEYFYLNQITEFTGEGPTECQLWRL